MFRMKQHMRLMGHWRFKVFFIHCKYILILMGEPDIRVIIQIIKVTAAAKRQLFPVMDRLPAAADTSSGTCHDLYEVIMYLAPLYLLQ